MRSVLGRRLARVEQAAARRPTINDVLRAMSDEELEMAMAECRQKIEVLRNLDMPDIGPTAHRANAP